MLWLTHKAWPENYLARRGNQSRILFGTQLLENYWFADTESMNVKARKENFEKIISFSSNRVSSVAISQLGVLKSDWMSLPVTFHSLLRLPNWASNNISAISLSAHILWSWASILNFEATCFPVMSRSSSVGGCWRRSAAEFSTGLACSSRSLFCSLVCPKVSVGCSGRTAGGVAGSSFAFPCGSSLGSRSWELSSCSEP